MDEDERRLRAAAMDWLTTLLASGRDVVHFDELAAFHFDGERIPLMDRQRGIRKPSRLDAALSIRTTYTSPGQAAPYEDAEGPDGLLRYKYRGQNPDHPENVALRRAFQQQLPLIWFVATQPGAYVPIYPVWIVADEPRQLQFVVAFDSGQRYAPLGVVDDNQRRYVEHVTHQRLHQRVFRVRVLDAYRATCAICRLKYRPLLDAAHILPDEHPQGSPVVPNGLSLCKIHHAAYDANYLGVRPDYVVEVRRDVREDDDGAHAVARAAGDGRCAIDRSPRRSRPAGPDSSGRAIRDLSARGLTGADSGRGRSGRGESVGPWSAQPSLVCQAFFTKLYVDEDGDLRAEHARPFDMLLDPSVQTDAATWASCIRKAHKARTPPNMDQAKV